MLCNHDDGEGITVRSNKLDVIIVMLSIELFVDSKIFLYETKYDARVRFSVGSLQT